MTRGAEKWVDVNIYAEKETQPNDFIADLRSEGYQIVATTPDAESCDLDQFDISHKAAIFFGREKEGLSMHFLEHADVRLKIPIIGFTKSFNVSVAAGIVLYSLTKKLRDRIDVNWSLTEEEKFQKKINWYLRSIPNGQRLLNAYLKDHPELARKDLEHIINY